MNHQEKLKRLKELQEKMKDASGYSLDVVFGWIQEFFDTAMQMQIEMLDKDRCQHDPFWELKRSLFPGKVAMSYLGNPKCWECGKELVAEWKAK